MAKPDWGQFQKIKRFTAENFREFAEAGRECFDFPEGAKIEHGVFALLRGWGRSKTVGVSLENCHLVKQHFEELASAPIGALYLERCRFKDSEAAALSKARSLRLFFGEDTDVGDKTCRALSACKHLETIDLTSTPVTDKGIQAIAALPKLETLYLHDTRVTDKGIAALAAVKTLKDLGLSDTTGVTDAGLMPLAGLARLKIDQTDSAITAAGVRAFIQAQREAKRAGTPKGKSAKTGRARGQNLPSKPDATEVDAAKKVLLAFFKGMNTWELEKQLRDRLDNNERVPKRLMQLARRRTNAQLKADIRAIFTKHCTRKKRVYGRADSGHFYTTPPTYHQPSKMKIVAAQAPTARKLVLYTNVWNGGEYQFVMVKKGDAWLVDHKKMLLGKWDRAEL